MYTRGPQIAFPKLELPKDTTLLKDRIDDILIQLVGNTEEWQYATELDDECIQVVMKGTRYTQQEERIRIWSLDKERYSNERTPETPRTCI